MKADSAGETPMSPGPDRCDSGSCGCGPSSLPRREFLAISGLGLAGLFKSSEAVAGPFDDKEFASIIPPDKKFTPEWLARLTARGEPEAYTGNDLRFIGMPVGGLCTGTLYLSGDGRLWLWNIFNKDVEGIDPKTVTYAGQQLKSRDGSAYVAPPEPMGPVGQGFWLRVRSAGIEKTTPLDRSGFREVTFLGQYPVGTVTYRDPEVPVSVRLEAYSPFIPLDADDSGLPATVMSFTLTNPSPGEVEVTLAGWLENAVGLDHRDLPGIRRNRITDDPGFSFLECSAAKPKKNLESPRPDIVFEDWTKDTYEDWTAEGSAFGRGPIPKAKMPAYQGDVGGPGTRVVNSHASAPGDTIAAKDDQTGKLTSRPFTIDRNYLLVWVGGGSATGETCVNLRVDGKVVRSITGRDSNRMHLESLGTRPWLGKPAVLEIVDSRAGGWGNIGVGRITFSDVPGESVPFESLPDIGTMGLALLGRHAEHRVAMAEGNGLGGKPGDTAQVPLDSKLVGSIGRTLTLKAGESATVHVRGRLALSEPDARGPPEGALLCDPVLDGDRRGPVRRRELRPALVGHQALARHLVRLDAPLLVPEPDVRQHVRPGHDDLLPTRRRPVLGLGGRRLLPGHLHPRLALCPGDGPHLPGARARACGSASISGSRSIPKTGVIRYRGEYGDTFAVDGQCGTILRAYREHQMSPDDRFLKRLWPGIKRALQCVIDRDADGSGVLRGPMHNTLDADWYGVVPWLVGLYHAALRAGEAMAERDRRSGVRPALPHPTRKGDRSTSTSSPGARRRAITSTSATRST